MRMHVELELIVTKADGAPVDADELQGHLDDVMDALIDQGAVDPDISAVLANGCVTVSVTTEGGRLEDVVAAAAAQVRAAVHGAGGITEGWPTNEAWLADITGSTQRRVDQPVEERKVAVGC